MLNLIKFSESTDLFSVKIAITTINNLNGKKIHVKQIPEANLETFKRTTTIKETAIIINALIKQRHNNYSFGNSYDIRKAKAIDNLALIAGMLGDFTTPEQQAKFVIKNMYRNFKLIAPRPGRFPSFDNFMELLSIADAKISLQQLQNVT